MSDQSMRGMRLGAVSMESAAGAGLEPRQNATFICAANHSSVVVFSIEADVPPHWECKVCGKSAALQVAGTVTEHSLPEVESGRSHWQMLLERRSIPELEEILEERLELLRERRSKAS